MKEALLKNIKRRMTPQPLKIRADVELTCFQYDGIEHIRSAMRAAEAASKEVGAAAVLQAGGSHSRASFDTAAELQGPGTLCLCTRL